MSKYTLESVNEMNKRIKEAQEFYTLLDEFEQPYIVTDKACLYDIYLGDETELIIKIFGKYGLIIKQSDFKLPLWQLLDFLKLNRTK